MAWKKVAKGLGDTHDWLEALVYGGLGAALLGAILFGVGSAVFASGSWAMMLGFSVVLAGTVTATVRDLRHRRLGLVTTCLLVCWALCTAFVFLTEL